MHAREHREDAGERENPPRQQRLDVLVRQPAEEARDGVDQAVDRLEGERLTLVTTAGEDHGVGSSCEVLAEMREQGGLPHARAAAHVHHHGLAVRAGAANRIAKLLHLVVASDEGRIEAAASDRRRGCAVALPGQATKHLRAGWPSRRVHLEQIVAERVEVGGHVGV